MPLINKRLIDTQLSVTAIPPAHHKILSDWQESIESRRIFSQKETALHSRFIRQILVGVLGYQGFSGACWTLSQEQKIGRGSVDIALGRFTADEVQVIAPFELKGAKTKDLDAIMAGRHKSPVQQAWEYAMDARGAQWVLVSNYVEIRLYAVGYGRQDYEVWQLAELTDPDEYARFIWLLSADQLLTGNSSHILEQSEQLDKTITAQLYQDYKALREHLLSNLQADNPRVPALELIRYTQKILDRILFIAFAEDRGLLPDRTLAQAYEHHDNYNPRPVWENFIGLFNAINKGSTALNIPAYNGGLFAKDKVLDRLNVSDSVCEAFKELGEYDFESEVSVTVLGHIFEQSISDIEVLQAQARGEQVAAVSKRKKHGVVYTPDHITRFIVEQTLGAHVEARFQALWEEMAAKRYKRGEKVGQWRKASFEISFWREYQNILRNTRVLDPACGSGAFLVAAFDFLHEEYTRVNDKLADLSGSYDISDLDKEILNRNLFGVDINEESIEITKLSLWLKTAKRGKLLNSLDANLHAANSLISDAAYTDKPFDWDAFKVAITPKRQETVTGFDVVLGNPPYVRQELFSDAKPYLQSAYEVYHGVADLYAYFFELGIKLLKPEGRLGYISSSTFFKTGSGENLRRFLMQNVALETVVDFGDLQIFEGVTTYPAILTMCKRAPSTDHALTMLTLKKTLPEDLAKEFVECASTMSQTHLEESAWRLESDQLVALRHKIITGKPTLKEVYGSPLYGIKTGLNEAFVIDRATRDQLVEAEPHASEVIKPFLEGKDLHKWRVEGRDLWLIFIPWHFPLHNDATIRGASKEAEQAFIEQYPVLYNHLSQYKEKLSKRNKAETGIRYEWYALQRWAASYFQHFAKQKIIYAHFQSAPLFSINKNGIYCNNKAYISSTMGFYELGLLNSNTMWFIFSAMTTMVRGGYFEATTQNVNNFPIPPATEPQKQQIADLAEQCQTLAENRYKKQEAIRRRIPDLCPAEQEAKLNTKLKNWWTLDFPTFRKEIKKAFKQDIPLQERNDWEEWLNAEKEKIQQLTQEIMQREKQINAYVYALFELIEEDIQLLEQQI